MAKDVVVVGAGIAGLTTAWRLVQAGRSVVVLEARERVGGRIQGFSVGERVVQLGGRWIGPGQNSIKRLAAVALYDTPFGAIRAAPPATPRKA